MFVSASFRVRIALMNRKTYNESLLKFVSHEKCLSMTFAWHLFFDSYDMKHVKIETPN